MTAAQQGEAPSRGGETVENQNRNHPEYNLSTRHLYFARTPTFLLCVDIEGKVVPARS